MQYFTVQARSHWEAIDRMKSQYGPSARPLTSRNIRYGGILGMFKKEGVEITCYVSREPPKNGQALAEEKRKILEAAGKTPTMQQILQEIRGLKREIAHSGGHSPQEHPTIKKIRQLLDINGFSSKVVSAIENRIRTEFSLDALDNLPEVQRAVVDWLAESIRIKPDETTSSDGPRVLSIVGPTGVGKTTTVAKLAAIYSLGRGSASRANLTVRIVTIDNYKIAAKQQIETYAKIMQIPVSFAETRSDLAKILDLYHDVDVILIDTIGKNPNDLAKLGEMQSVLSACGSRSETHLAVSATTKASDIEEILRQFEPFKYDAIILTKLDETSKLGNVLSVFYQNRKCLSFLTDGQIVPHDIEPATAGRLLMCLEGFRVEREQIESKFGLKCVDT